MKVSAIIPVWNEAPLIAEAIKRAWRAGADEVIVCDGGSEDASAAIARMERCRLVESLRGRAVQQNCGARAASGDVLLFLHADNWLEESAVEQIKNSLQNERIVCGAFRQRIDARGAGFRLLEFGNSLRVRLLGVAYGDQGIFVRREAFEAVGGFPEIALMEDLRIMRKLRRLGRPVLLNGVLHVSPRRWQRHGIIRQTLRNWCLLAAEKCGVSPERLARYYATK